VQRLPRGFTLIETLVATAILLPAIIHIGFVFVYATAATRANGQRAASTLLVSEKLEQLQSLPDRAAWTSGRFEEYVRIDADGTLVVSPSDTDAPYLRVWQVAAGSPPVATVIVYSLHAGLARQPIESARATTYGP
jgi:prepilin-type N-terminal cleavage/methylation domain-containing protein